MLRTIMFVAVLILTVLVLGCQAQTATPTTAPSKPAPTATGPTPTKAPATTPTPQVKKGGILKVAQSREQTNLDPHIDTMGSFQSNTFNKLIRLNMENKIVGDTAEKWEISPDGKSVTFYLRKGIKFWNVPPANGREVTCDDWVYSLTRIGSPEPQFQGKDLVDGITGKQCVDKYTLKLTTDPAFAPLLNNLTRYYIMAVVPKEAIEQWGDMREKMLATGPFMIKEWVKGQVTHYVKNPDYFIPGVPYLDGIDALVMPDKAARIAALRTGQVDFLADGYTPRDKETVEKTNPGIKWVFNPGGTDSIRMNVTKKPFEDWRVRYAINLAIDRKQLIQLGVFGAARVSGYISPSWGELGLPMNQILAFPGYRYPKDQDIAEAKRLLAEAGYPNGFKTTSYNWEFMWDYAAPVKAELAKIGIDVDMQNVPLTVWKPKMLEKDYEMAMGNASMRADVDGEAYAQFHPKGGFNESGIDIPELNVLLEKQRQLLDPAKRGEVLRELELKLQKLGSWIPIGQRMYWTPYQSYVKGIEAGDLPIPYSYYYAYVPYMWLDK